MRSLLDVDAWNVHEVPAITKHWKVHCHIMCFHSWITCKADDSNTPLRPYTP